MVCALSGRLYLHQPPVSLDLGQGHIGGGHTPGQDVLDKVDDLFHPDAAQGGVPSSWRMSGGAGRRPLSSDPQLWGPKVIQIYRNVPVAFLQSTRTLII